MVGFLKALFSTNKWNNETGQHELVALILEAAIDAAEKSKPMAFVSIHKVFDIRNKYGWSYREASDRCVHAVSMIKPAVEDDVYRLAKQAAQDLYVSLRAAG